MRLTLGQIKNSRIPAVLNIPATDSRFVQIINEAQERLIKRGRWTGTTWRIKICASSGCITWPRQVAAVDAVIVDCTPIQCFDRWYEFLSAGPGLQDDGCGLKLIDRPSACTVADIANTVSKVRIYPDSASDVGKTVVVEGYDENADWILASDGTNGEAVTLALPYVQTTNFFSSVTGIQKATTVAAVRAYAYNTTAATEMLLGLYEPDENKPWYRRSLIVGLTDYAEGSEDGTVEVTAEVKLEHIPLVNDGDWLMIANLPALKDMARAIVLSEQNRHEEALLLEQKALGELEAELRHYRGAGTVATLRVQDPWVFGAGMVESAN